MYDEIYNTLIAGEVFVPPHKIDFDGEISLANAVDFFAWNNACAEEGIKPLSEKFKFLHKSLLRGSLSFNDYYFFMADLMAKQVAEDLDAVKSDIENEKAILHLED